MAQSIVKGGFPASELAGYFQRSLRDPAFMGFYGAAIEVECTRSDRFNI